MPGHLRDRLRSTRLAQNTKRLSLQTWKTTTRLHRSNSSGHFLERDPRIAQMPLLFPRLILIRWSYIHCYHRPTPVQPT